MTDEIAKDIVAALGIIASQLEYIGDSLYEIQVRLDEITPETNRGQRYLRTLDIGRD